MYIKNLIRWTGISLIIAGILSPLAVLIHPTRETVNIILSHAGQTIPRQLLYGLWLILLGQPLSLDHQILIIDDPKSSFRSRE